MNSLTLYQISEQFRALEAMATDDEIPDEAIRDTLEALQGDFQVKARNVAAFVRNMEVFADDIDAAAAAMKARATRFRNRSASIRNYLLVNMQASGISKIECPEFRIAVRDNPESVRIAEGAQIPAQFMRQAPPPPPVVDKVGLKAALRAGEQVDGCWLERGTRLEIKA